MTVWETLALLPSELGEGVGRPAAVLIPLFEDDSGELWVILIKRTRQMRTHPGELAFPGGMPVEEDDGPVATALREAHEEVGIAAEEVEVLGVLDPVPTLSRMVVPVVGRVAVRPALRPDPAEVEAVFELPLQRFLEEDGWRREDWQGREMWFFDVEQGEVLWGASARMLRALLAHLRDSSGR